MCFFQHRFSSSNTPRNFKYFVVLFHYYLYLILVKGMEYCPFCSVCEKNEHFVLLIFSGSLFEINHWLILSNWRFVVSKRKLISLCVRKRLVSSAYMIEPIDLLHFLGHLHTVKIAAALLLNLAEHHMYLFLVLYFLPHLFEWIVSCLINRF